MSESSPHSASGLQIAFLVFAVALLAAPADKHVFAHWEWAKNSGFPIGRAMLFVFAGVVLLCFPALRHRCRVLLAVPVPNHKRGEIFLIVGLNLGAAFAAAGVFALWWWSTGGEPSLARRMGGHSTFGTEWARAIMLETLVTFFIIGGVLGPIVEELVFRGMLYPAWKRQWGWIRSALATSVVFAAVHPAGNGVSQFLASILFICLFRRTGSLRASIYAHSMFNILLWYPLLGRYIFPPGRETGEISTWIPNLACLALMAIAVPLYIWMARDDRSAISVRLSSPGFTG